MGKTWETHQPWPYTTQLQAVTKMSTSFSAPLREQVQTLRGTLIGPNLKKIMLEYIYIYILYNIIYIYI